MFRTNKDHLQPYLISNVKDLPKKYRKHLDKSWDEVFYKEIFCWLDEEVNEIFSQYLVELVSYVDLRKRLYHADL